MKWLLTAFMTCMSAPANACGLALLLAVDVSGSVDGREYDIQMQGLAAALRDGLVAEALVRQQAHLALLQWTGSSRQRVTLPWTEMRDFTAVDAFADAVAEDSRVWRNYSTAIGEALTVAHAEFEAGPDCERNVVDVSGDGISNEGVAPEGVKGDLSQAGVTVNALAIETDSADLTGYFFEHVIAGEGAFVLTADGFEDYPRQIRLKLQREVKVHLSDEMDVITHKIHVITEGEFCDHSTRFREIVCW